MKRILYANGSILTADAIAHSVVRYAAALAKSGSADTVMIPVISGNKHHTVEMLVGPASQLMVEDADAGEEASFDASFLAELEVRRELLENPPPIAPRATSTEPFTTFDEF